MGDSACLMQPFSYTAGLPNEANEGNRVHGLGQSISFGRFMSESLAWEKWSTFSHNKYVEEAERYARPGSVAQKKAFFEAHYKTLAARKAAAMLEQANAAAAINASETETEARGKKLALHQDVKTSSTEFGSNSELVKIESRNFEEVADSVDEPQLLLEVEIRDLEVKETYQVKNYHVRVNQSRLLGDDKELELSEGTQMEKPLLKNGKTSQDEFEVTSKRRPSNSSSKVSTNARTSKVPSSPANFKAPIRPNKGNNLTPMAKSTGKPINFTHAKELSKLTSTIIRKIDGSRIDLSSKASKECPTPLRTPNKASIRGKLKQPAATPWSENRSARTPVIPSSSVGKTARGKWNFLPTEKKTHSPGIFASFNLRTEERAARRKQRLEEKFNASQEQKVQQQTTLKEKAETELKKLRQSFCFKARPLPDFYKERTLKDQIQKIQLTKPESLAIGRKSTPSKASIVQSKNSLSCRKSSIKNTCFLDVSEKQDRTSARSLASRIAMTAHENTSPNIQHT